ncbi:MAG: PQQ-like beta-propeller repeat protein [Candidatus Aenigmatarchaeota archaeon]|nr:MAG: PQQ-like beta-propeller repeat protein [Candidatus Aenigmarchaeota archaeon]
MNGFPFHIMENTIFITSNDHNLYALSLEGKEKWRFTTGNYITSSCPNIYGGRIFFGSYDGNFYCLDIKTGEEVWRFRTGQEDLGEHKALIIDEKIYFGAADCYFYCLDMNGKVLWKFKTKGGIWSGPASYKNLVIFGSFDCNLYALEKDTGEVVWVFESADKNQTPWEYVITGSEKYNEPENHFEGEDKKGIYKLNEAKFSVSSHYIFQSEYKVKLEYQSSGAYNQ